MGLLHVPDRKELKSISWESALQAVARDVLARGGGDQGAMTAWLGYDALRPEVYVSLPRSSLWSMTQPRPNYFLSGWAGAPFSLYDSLLQWSCYPGVQLYVGRGQHLRREKSRGERRRSSQFRGNPGRGDRIDLWLQSLSEAVSPEVRVRLGDLSRALEESIQGYADSISVAKGRGGGGNEQRPSFVLPLKGDHWLALEAGVEDFSPQISKWRQRWRACRSSIEHRRSPVDQLPMESHLVGWSIGWEQIQSLSLNLSSMHQCTGLDQGYEDLAEGWLASELSSDEAPSFMAGDLRAEGDPSQSGDDQKAEGESQGVEKGLRGHLRWLWQVFRPRELSRRHSPSDVMRLLEFISQRHQKFFAATAPVPSINSSAPAVSSPIVLPPELLIYTPWVWGEWMVYDVFRLWVSTQQFTEEHLNKCLFGYDPRGRLLESLARFQASSERSRPSCIAAAAVDSSSRSVGEHRGQLHINLMLGGMVEVLSLV